MAPRVISELKDWFHGLEKLQRVCLISSAIAVISYILNPMKLQFAGAACAIGILTFLTARFFAKIGAYSLLKGLPLIVLMGAFAYLRRYPFNPGHFHFWLMIIAFLSTIVAVITMLSSSINR